MLLPSQRTRLVVGGATASLLVLVTLGLTFGAEGGSAPTGLRKGGAHVGELLPLSEEDALPRVHWTAPLMLNGLDGLVASLNPKNRYVTSWLFAGFTNQVMELINLIYVARLAGLIPVLPPFQPDGGHLHGSAPALLPTDVFDIPDLMRRLRSPFLNLEAVRPVDDYGPDEQETIPCWGVLQTQSGDCARGNFGQAARVSRGLKLAKIPLPTELYATDWAHPTLYEPLARFLRDPALAASWSASSGPSDLLGSFRAYNNWEPDDGKKCIVPAIRPQPERDVLACLDGTYYMASEDMPKEGYPATGVEEQYEQGYPVWQVVGRHMRFAKRWEEAAREAERRLLGVGAGEEVPKFLAVHIRRGDKVPHDCQHPTIGKTDPDCKPLSAFSDKLAATIAQARQRGRLGWGGMERVLVMSDDTQGWFIEEVEQMGYIFVDHAKLRSAEEHENFGPWAATIIDSIIMTHAECFVGSGWSTMSKVAARRGTDWYGHQTILQ